MPIAIQLAAILTQTLIVSSAVNSLAMNTANAQIIPSRVVQIVLPDPIQAYIAQTAVKKGVDPHLAIFIAKNESGFDPKVKNPNSSARGIFQFIDKTWDWACEGDRLDYKDNTDCAIELLSKGQISHWTADHIMKKKLQEAGFIK